MQVVNETNSTPYCFAIMLLKVSVLFMVAYGVAVQMMPFEEFEPFEEAESTTAQVVVGANGR